MSFYEESSIIITPNAYKAGTLYAVVPVPTLGAEEVTNGDFATNLDSWSTSSWWVWNALGAYHPSTSSHKPLYQEACEIGKTYLITFDLNCVGSSLAKFSLGSSSGSTTQVIDQNLPTGSYSYVVTAAAEYVVFNRQNTAEYYVNNVSVKEYTSADMDVTRATAATRVDENGLVNYAEIIGGEEVTCGDFSCAVPTDYWTATNAVVSFSNNEVTIDDTAGAGADSRAAQNFPTTSGKSYRVRFNRVSTTSQFYLGIGNGLAYSNIFYSALGTTTGEYTLQFTATGASSTIALITAASGITVYSNVSVKQVDRDNVPRIDYAGGGCPHILAEPQRTNLLPYSEDFSQWTQQSKITLTPNSISSPSGVVNGYKIIPTSLSGIHQLRENLSTVSGDYTLSIFAKQGEYKNILLWDDSLSGGVGVNLDDLSVFRNQNNQSYNIEDYGSGWVRISITLSYSSQQMLPSIYIYDNSATPQIIFTGNDIDGLYIWGAQSEAGSYPTSYIPTSGATVTRNQDQFTRDGIGSLINSTEGVLFVEASTFENGADCRITLSDGTITNRVSIEWDILANTIKGFVGSDGNLVSPASYNQTDSNKIALKYKENDCALWINGVEVDTDFSVSALSGVNQLEFSNYGGTVPFEGKVNQLQVYPTALSDAELETITSWVSFSAMAETLNYTIK